ncbi:protein kinase [Lentisphaera profundi]|uniref:Protein kinase n=1 Tax=Lentisphaera profundi TaxID=1658616 RepID=A0ABY7VYT6_9BACT|nr:protein kinase [Lentisphaera profundi]WDE99441.1 protein kinase [Lentisphaera profundi]
MSTSLASLRKNKQTTTFVFKRSDLDSALSPLEQISLTVDAKHVNASDNYSFIAEETIDNLDRTKIAGISQNNYTTDITCSQCHTTSTFTSTNLFEKVACPSCQLKFRIPIETELFLYDKHIFESPFINIFRAHHKQSEFYGDVVVYEKIPPAPNKTSNVEEIFKHYNKLDIENYIRPLTFDKDENAYYITRKNAPYRMNLYLEEFGALPDHQAAHVLYNVTKTLAKLATYSCYGAVLPSDIMLELDGSVKICDYGFREALHSINQAYNYLPLPQSAPETIFSKVHNEASTVYSLGILALAFIGGQQVFSENDPHKVIQERQDYFDNFSTEKFPSFLQSMLDRNPKYRPKLKECREFFFHLDSQNISH